MRRLPLPMNLRFLIRYDCRQHDIESVFIDSLLKQADITPDNLSVFLDKLSQISSENEIEFYTSIGLEKNDLPALDPSLFVMLN